MGHRHGRVLRVVLRQGGDAVIRDFKIRIPLRDWLAENGSCYASSSECQRLIARIRDEVVGTGAVRRGRRDYSRLPLDGVVYSNRERDIVALMHQNLTDPEIAGRLSLSVQTVKNHLHSARVKAERQGVKINA